MGDNLKPEDRLKTMRAVKSKGTKLEKRLFALLATMRLKGWKKNVEGVAGKPDVAFVDQRVAVFVDGCFWHGCPHCNRKLPQTNREYWEKKIKRNVALAELHNEQLRRDGWTVIRIWEHEIADAAAVKSRILEALKKQGAMSEQQTS